MPQQYDMPDMPDMPEYEMVGRQYNITMTALLVPRTGHACNWYYQTVTHFEAKAFARLSRGSPLLLQKWGFVLCI